LLSLFFFFIVLPVVLTPIQDQVITIHPVVCGFFLVVALARVQEVAMIMILVVSISVVATLMAVVPEEIGSTISYKDNFFANIVTSPN
jgi:hypothetical protein